MITTAAMLLKWGRDHNYDLSVLQGGEIFLLLIRTGYGGLLDKVFNHNGVKKIHTDDLDVMWGNELIELLGKQPSKPRSI